MLESPEDHAVEFKPTRKSRGPRSGRAYAETLRRLPAGHCISNEYFGLAASRVTSSTLAQARPKHFGTQARQAVRVIALNVGDEFFADLAAKIEGFRGIGGRREDAQLHGLVGGIGYLEIPEAFIPQMAGFDDCFQRLAGLFDGQCIVHPDENGSQQLGRHARPVLKWLFDEIT